MGEGADDAFAAGPDPRRHEDASGDIARPSRPEPQRRRRSRVFERRAQRHDYDAFISYSHAGDTEVANALQRALQGFARPWYRLRSLRVFRDSASLPASSALWSTIQRALESSRFFLLIASPEAASRPWVAQEVEWWRERKSVDTLLIVLAGGEIVWDEEAGDFDWQRTTALPVTLRQAYVEEPLFVDLRVVRDATQLSSRHPALREAVATLSAAILGRPRDELIGEDIRRHRRAMQVAAAAGAAILCFAGIAAWQWMTATQQRDRAREQAALALSRQLAAQSSASLDESSVLAVLLGLEAYRTVEDESGPRSFEARNSMLAALEREPRAIWILPLIANCVAFAPDGRTLALAGEDGAVQLWDPVHAARLGPPLSGHTDAVSTVTFSPDGTMVASGGRDSTVLVWSVSRRTVIHTLRGHRNIVTSLAFGRDGRTLASADGDEILLWTLGRTAAHKKVLHAPRGFAEAIAFSPDGKTFASAGERGALLWNLRQGPRWRRIGAGPAARLLESIAFSPDGHSLVAGGLNGMFFWDLDPSIRLRRHRAGDIRSISFSSDGGRLVTGNGDGTVRLWEVSSASQIGSPLRGHRGWAWSVAFSPLGTVVASASFDATVRVWRARRQPPLGQSVRGNGELPPAISALTYAHDARTLISADETGVLRRWRGARPHVVNAKMVVPEDSWGTALSPDGTEMAVVTSEGALRLSRTAGQQRPDTALAGPLFAITSVAFSPDGKHLVAGSKDGSIRVWNVQTKMLVRHFKARGEVQLVSFGHDGEILALSPMGEGLGGQGDGLVTFWKTRTRLPLREVVIRHSGPIIDVALSPDGRFLASAGLDGTIRLWDVDKRRLLGEPLRGHRDAVFDLAFAPDGSALASGSRDGTVRLWDISRSAQLGQPLDASDQVSKVVFSPDGHSLASGGMSGTITVWKDILPGSDFSEWRNRLCAIAQRNMTRSEWEEFLPGEAYRTTCPAVDHT